MSSWTEYIKTYRGPECKFVSIQHLEDTFVTLRWAKIIGKTQKALKIRIKEKELDSSKF